MQGDALQTIVIEPSQKKKYINDVLTVFRQRFVGTKTMAYAGNKRQTLVSDTTKQKLHQFINDLQ